MATGQVVRRSLAAETVVDAEVVAVVAARETTTAPKTTSRTALAITVARTAVATTATKTVTARRSAVVVEVEAVAAGEAARATSRSR